MRDILIFVGGVLFSIALDAFRLWREHVKLKIALQRTIHKESLKPEQRYIPRVGDTIATSATGYEKNKETLRNIKNQLLVKHAQPGVSSEIGKALGAVIKSHSEEEKVAQMFDQGEHEA